MKLIEAVQEVWGKGVKTARVRYFGYTEDETGCTVWDGSACALGAALIACDPTAPTRWQQEVGGLGESSLSRIMEFISETMGIGIEETRRLINVVPGINDSIAYNRIVTDFEANNRRPNWKDFTDTELYTTMLRVYREAQDRYVDNNFADAVISALQDTGVRDIEICVKE